MWGQCNKNKNRPKAKQKQYYRWWGGQRPPHLLYYLFLASALFFIFCIGPTFHVWHWPILLIILGQPHIIFLFPFMFWPRLVRRWVSVGLFGTIMFFYQNHAFWGGCFSNQASIHNFPIGTGRINVFFVVWFNIQSEKIPQSFLRPLKLQIPSFQRLSETLKGSSRPPITFN